MAASASFNPASTVAALRATFATGRTKTIEWRVAQLNALKRLVFENQDAISAALRLDLNKCATEALVTEFAQVFMEVDFAIKSLPKWMKPRSQSAPNMLTMMDGIENVFEPLGVILLITPWNYPSALVFLPLISSIAAGNCSLSKLSEVSVNTSAVLAELFPRYMDSDAIRAVVCGAAETTEILELRFDHISYTGSTAVGRIIMAAAAKHLTPVTLELGGKSPVIVADDSDLTVAARRVLWGKFINAGQSCIAPDYVLVVAEREQAFLDALRATTREFLGEDAHASADYGRIINERHFDRIMRLIDPARAGSDFEVVFGGAEAAARADRYIPPTVLRNVRLDAAVMEEEIFGPVLPVIAVESVDAAIEIINARPKPLALYLFTNSKTVQRDVIARTSSGTTCINDTMTQHGVYTLPFGGVGDSGMGAHHGEYGFESFSHRRAVYIKSQGLEGAHAMRYAPYDASKVSNLKWALGYPKALESSSCSIQ
eukprot:a339_181.p1 GENE.a339_181~~a339_181.p1  ORF type:complete len:497 (-),score=228.56 a339_181:14-1474(-)